MVQISGENFKLCVQTETEREREREKREREPQR